jgi:hypothetical protein
VFLSLVFLAMTAATAAMETASATTMEPATTASAVKSTAATLSDPRYREKATYEEELRKSSHDTYLLSESMLH